MTFNPRATRLVGLALVAIAAGVVYGMITANGNHQHAGACSATPERLAALNAAAKGELAAFQVADPATPLPPLAFKGADGSETTMEAFSGKVALINLWATWCIPCRKEMPDFAALKRDYGGTAFDVVAINLDRGGPDKPAAFLEEVGADNLALNTDPKSDTFQTLKGKGLAIGLPSTILADKDGCRIGHLIGPAKWDSTDGRALIEAALNL